MELRPVLLLVEAVRAGHVVGLLDRRDSLRAFRQLVDMDLKLSAAKGADIGEDPEVRLRVGQLNGKLLDLPALHHEAHQALRSSVLDGQVKVRLLDCQFSHDNLVLTISVSHPFSAMPRPPRRSLRPCPVARPHQGQNGEGRTRNANERIPHFAHLLTSCLDH